MARIRTIKPDFWQHPKVTKVSRDARLLFLGLLNEADDVGKLRWSPKRIAGVLFPDDEDVGAGEIDRWALELAGAGLVELYAVAGARLLLVRGFTEHQRINRPSPSILPDPLTEPSLSPQREVTEPARGEVEREQGMEEEQGEPPVSLTLVSPPASRPDPVVVVFEAWQESTGHRNTKLDKKRRGCIERALDLGYPTDDLIDACHGWKHSPHHRGENDRHTVYDDVTLLLRDADHIERFRDLARGGRRPDATTSPVFGGLARYAAREAQNGAIDV